LVVAARADAKPADMAHRRQGPVAFDEVAVAPGGVWVGSGRSVAGAVGIGQPRYALSTATSSAHCADSSGLAGEELHDRDKGGPGCGMA